VNEKILNEGNQIHNFFPVSVGTFVIPFYYSSGSGTEINNGSGSANARKYITVPVPLRQKVPVSMFPVRKTGGKPSYICTRLRTGHQMGDIRNGHTFPCWAIGIFRHMDREK
jgi:hypothetical protein